MATIYLIEYYNVESGKRERYLNNTSFETIKKAVREIELLKTREQKQKKITGKIRRTHFKIVPHEIKKNLKKEIK